MKRIHQSRRSKRATQRRGKNKISKEGIRKGKEKEGGEKTSPHEQITRRITSYTNGQRKYTHSGGEKRGGKERETFKIERKETLLSEEPQSQLK